MKTQTESVRKDKNIDVLISMISGKEILDASQMLSIRGGDGEVSEPPKPNEPKI